MSAAIDDLKTAGDLVEKAAELIRGAAKETSLPSVALRHAAGEQISRIRLQMMLLRRDLTILHELANGKKPKKRGSQAEHDDAKLK